MTASMQGGERGISILLAVYEPRLDWLREQLSSLEAQSCRDVRLYVRDDCSPTVPLEEIEGCVRECIRSMPWELRRNEENMGSSRTFERLTQEACGEYFAYCDQDDIWLPEKLEELRRELEESGAVLACSDMYIIDGEGRQRADSMTKVRRRHRFRSGKDLAEGLLISNFAAGCTMLVRAGAAKAAVPFCPYMVHDHYIALCCAAAGGEIRSVPRPLIRYRIHGGNQTGLLAGVDSRESYLELRVRALCRRLEWLAQHLPAQSPQLHAAILDRLLWARARAANLEHRGGGRTVWRSRRFAPRASIFELVAPWLPETIFLYIVNLVRKNKL